MAASTVPTPAIGQVGSTAIAQVGSTAIAQAGSSAIGQVGSSAMAQVGSSASAVAAVPASALAKVGAPIKTSTEVEIGATLLTVRGAFDVALKASRTWNNEFHVLGDPQAVLLSACKRVLAIVLTEEKAALSVAFSEFKGLPENSDEKKVNVKEVNVDAKDVKALETLHNAVEETQRTIQELTDAQTTIESHRAVFESVESRQVQLIHCEYTSCDRFKPRKFHPPHLGRSR
jgi:hypothetical protein